jgi:hypothetical protein
VPAMFVRFMESMLVPFGVSYGMEKCRLR